ncbi:uncharacterized protein LOC127288696 [Leptopilina boulardi]|uniref:uncharacterized protein LOC127288696 n=1 Tax=Leptopilina boulardi TaxID=63433 RepID=UPI0021F5B364|nr:uncharacterized protein LOC127288696 [Leptopilina boulardi]
MRLAIFLVFLSIACSFLTIAAERKVIFMIPRHVRRSPGASWHSHMRPPPLRKSHYTADDNYPHLYNRPNSIIYGKPAFRHGGNYLPHGGDDFDQDHEGINNVVVPHGKGISHGISFGHGYIPYDKIKGNYVPLKEGFVENHSSKDSSEDSAFSPIDPSHVSLTTESDTDSFLPGQSGSYDIELNGKTIDDQSKLFNSRSLAKASYGDKLSLDNVNSASAGEEKSIIANDYSTSSQVLKSETTSSTPIFVPSPKIGGSTRGVVIRDSVSLDDYNRKVEEFTKTWPGVVNIPGIHGSNIQHVGQNIQQLPISSFAGSSFPASSSWTSSLAGNQGYSVREDIVEPEYDFRTMPIQNSPVYSFPNPGSATLPNIQSSYS